MIDQVGDHDLGDADGEADTGGDFDEGDRASRHLDDPRRFPPVGRRDVGAVGPTQL